MEIRVLPEGESTFFQKENVLFSFGISVIETVLNNNMVKLQEKETGVITVMDFLRKIGRKKKRY